MTYHIFQDPFKKWRWYLMKNRDRIATGEGYNSRSACEEAILDNGASGGALTQEGGLPLEKERGTNQNPVSEREKRFPLPGGW